MKTKTKRVTFVVATALCMVTPVLNEAYGGSQTMREKLQSTIGGAEYVVTGEVTNVNGNKYTIQTSGGESIDLEVTDDTNMFCKSRSDRSQSHRTSTSPQPQSSMSGGNQQSQQTESNIGVTEKQAQSLQSQPSQRSKGFRIGDCPFEKGEMVKAELTDVGTVTFMRSLDDQGIQTARAGRNRDTNEAQGSGRSTEEMGLPQEYIFLPAGALGSMHVSKETEQYKVTTSDGEDIGQVYKVIINNQGDPAYVIIRMKEDQQLKPVPWQALQISPETQSVTLVISRAQIDQLPGYGPDDMTMRNIRSYWELAKEEKDRRVSRQQARFDPRDDRMNREDEGRYEDPYDRRQSRQFRDERDRQDRRFSSRDRDRFRDDRYGDERSMRDRDGFRDFDDDRYFSQEERSFYSQGGAGSRDRSFDDDRRDQQRRRSSVIPREYHYESSPPGLYRDERRGRY